MWKFACKRSGRTLPNTAKFLHLAFAIKFKTKSKNLASWEL